MGKVVFVGAGPGASDLITLRGAQRLSVAHAVLHDALIDLAGLRRLAPIARWIPVGKRGYCDSTAQTAINAALVKLARELPLVVRLKGGDPSVFGRLEEELQACAEAGIECEVVPGVTAAIAAAAVSQRPLTRRGSGRSVALATAVTAAPGAASDALPGATRATGRSADTEVYYMAGRQLAALARRLRHAGWPDDAPVLVVSRAGWPDEVFSEHRLDTLARASVLHAGRPAVVTIGAGARPVRAGDRADGSTLDTHQGRVESLDP